jgi:hypothetical protein
VGIEIQTTKKIKRKKGPKYKYKENVYRKKISLKDVKVKARENEHLKLLNIYVILGLGYRKIIPYKILNRVGKMTI